MSSTPIKFGGLPGAAVCTLPPPPARSLLTPPQPFVAIQGTRPNPTARYVLEYHFVLPQTAVYRGADGAPLVSGADGGERESDGGEQQTSTPSSSGAVATLLRECN